MSQAESSIVHRQIHILFSAGTLGDLTDGQLLDRFMARRDEGAESAFAALVERHGPMVLGVCRRILRNPQDAADAFQATFLILVQKAETVRVSDSLGRWLYGVSRRVALHARAESVRRSSIESPGSEALAAPAPEPDGDERVAVLDEEIARLPEKYRAAVLLCDLGTLTHEAAARQLGCPVGTVESRLSRGRTLLRERLARRGLAPAALGLVSGLSLRSASADVPPTLVATTVRTAVALATDAGVVVGTVSNSIAYLMKGAMRAMFLSRLKVAAATLLTIGVLGAGATILAGQEPRGEAKLGESTDRAKISALEDRVRELERKLDALLALQRDKVPADEKRRGSQAKVDPDALRKIRPRFECLVEKVHVKPGQPVKVGDPLVDLFSADLAAAKNDLLAKTAQWEHDQRLFQLREKLYKSGAIGEQIWVDTRNDEAKSRLDKNLARDRLRIYGLGDHEVEEIPAEDGERKARMTLRSPVGGTVISVETSPQDLADPKSVLLVITAEKPFK
jgi:RNA polymerase sigma factor (sigma-70 family)